MLKAVVINSELWHSMPLREVSLQEQINYLKTFVMIGFSCPVLREELL